MAYIYKKIVKGKPYYYLRVSKRIKDRVIAKDIAYLGDDPKKIESKLDKLPDIHKKEIRKAYRNIKKVIESEYYLNKAKKVKLQDIPHLDKESLQEIEAVKIHFNKSFLKHDELTIEENFKNFLIDFAFNTTSIEGNTITLKEVAKLLNEDLTPPNRTLREIYDLQNTEEVFFEILNSKDKIDDEFIIKIHDKLLNNIDKRKGYRTQDIRVFKGDFEASPAKYVRTDMKLLLEWYHKNKTKFHPFILAALFHQKFEKIHPFFDGNGRTGRMIMNYMLLREGYPPLIVRKARRDDYLSALKEGNDVGIKETSEDYYKELVKYLSEEMVLGYWNAFLI